MATQTIQIPEIGLVKLRKHAKSKTIKISIDAHSTVNVTMPRWIPYKMGVKFVITKKPWILKNLSPSKIHLNDDIIGKSHVLKMHPKTDITNITTRKKGSELWVYYSSQYSHESHEVQKKARAIAIKALRSEAEDMLPDRLRSLAQQHDFEVKSIEIRTLKARWGSCNSKKEITLNLYLMTLPWELIDYVILHELSHTKAMHHGPDFWRVFESVLPDAKKRRREIKLHKPSF